MELTKRTKIAGGVLVVGLVALGVDRFSGGPSGAAAANPPAPTPAPASPSAAPSAANEPAQPVSHQGALADRLNQIWSLPAPETVDDAFAAPVSWFPPAVVVKAKPKPENKTVDVSQFHLTTIMESTSRDDSKRGAAAIVDGHLITVSKPWTDGSNTIELIEASRASGSAKVRINGVEVELKLPQKGKADSRVDKTLDKPVQENGPDGSST